MCMHLGDSNYQGAKCLCVAAWHRIVMDAHVQCCFKLTLRQLLHIVSTADINS